MADHTHIEWTDATWNPITGCSVVSAGCKHCYAMKLAGGRLQHHPSRAGLTVRTQAGPVWNGKVRLNLDWLDQPLRWARPRRIFVCAHGDLFHESVPDEWISAVFGIMAVAPKHTFQVLTKRPERALRWFERMQDARTAQGYLHEAVKRSMGYSNPNRPAVNLRVWPLPNVWLGVSIEHQAAANERVPLLLGCPAAVRWVSAEPLLGPVCLTRLPVGGGWYDALRGWRDVRERFAGFDETIDWVVAGGESGPGARPMHPAWARSLRDQCAAAGVPFLFKQWGEWGQYVNENHYTHCGEERKPHAWVDGETTIHGLCWLVDDDGAWSNYTGEPPTRGDGQILERIAVMGHHGKKVAGRLLDGVVHDAYPEDARRG